MALAAIEMVDVSVEYHDGAVTHTVLKNVNLRVPQGASVVLIGPSGQGKTTMLKLMAGLTTPTQGKVIVGGKDLTEMNKNERYELLKTQGMLFQRNALFDSMNCAENIAFPLREVTKLPESEIQVQVDKFLDAVGILHAKNLFPDEISGGMQKRLGIARALALHPKIIFYDDPTAGLDPITSKKIIELILQLRKANSATIISVTNDMNRGFQLCSESQDLIVMVSDKNVITAGNAAMTKASTNPVIGRFMRGEVPA